MRIERWEDAIMAFVRCVQQDMEIGEAWANIGELVCCSTQTSFSVLKTRCNSHAAAALEPGVSRFNRGFEAETRKLEGPGEPYGGVLGAGSMARDGAAHEQPSGPSAAIAETYSYRRTAASRLHHVQYGPESCKNRSC